MVENTTGPNAAEAFSSNEEGTSSIFSDCPPVEKKKRTVGGELKHNWTLLTNISSCSKRSRFVYCKLCAKHFTVSHGGMNDIKHHVDWAAHQHKYKDLQGYASISNLFGRSQEKKLINTSRVTSAEVEMGNLIAMHNLISSS